MKEKQSAVIAIAAKLTDPDIAKVTIDTQAKVHCYSATRSFLCFLTTPAILPTYTHTYTNGINTVNVLVVISFWPPVLR